MTNAEWCRYVHSVCQRDFTAQRGGPGTRSAFQARMPTKAGTKPGMVQRWKKQWRDLRAAPPGERFQKSYREQKRADAERSWLAKAARPVLAVLSLAIGVVLVFIPGPAVLFFAISAALLASLSLKAARALDRTEVWARDAWSTVRARWRRRGHAH